MLLYHYQHALVVDESTVARPLAVHEHGLGVIHCKSTSTKARAHLHGMKVCSLPLHITKLRGS